MLGLSLSWWHTSRFLSISQSSLWKLYPSLLYNTFCFHLSEKRTLGVSPKSFSQLQPTSQSVFGRNCTRTKCKNTPSLPEQLFISDVQDRDFDRKGSKISKNLSIAFDIIQYLSSGAHQMDSWFCLLKNSYIYHVYFLFLSHNLLDSHCRKFWHLPNEFSFRTKSFRVSLHTELVSSRPLQSCLMQQCQLLLLPSPSPKWLAIFQVACWETCW